MILDVVFVLLLIASFYNGYTKGIIYSVLSLLAIVLGIIMAMNFSSLAAVWLHNNFNIPSLIMPALSFILVLLAVIGAVKLVAILSEKFLKAIMLNFVNKLAGGLLWSLITVLIFSLLVYLISKTGVFTENLMVSSYSYRYIMPLGPFSLDLVKSLIPYLKDSFDLINETVQEVAPQV
ncbi:MAG: CvpA family protein [Chitinophagales bacterium]|nr:CvpA family protein [Bacteroidota bacterium]MCB9257234.1 CvpA family protein [Chitinophagales bacterium]